MPESYDEMRENSKSSCEIMEDEGSWERVEQDAGGNAFTMPESRRGTNPGGCEGETYVSSSISIDEDGYRMENDFDGVMVETCLSPVGWEDGVSAREVCFDASRGDVNTDTDCDIGLIHEKMVGFYAGIGQFADGAKVQGCPVPVAWRIDYAVDPCRVEFRVPCLNSQKYNVSEEPGSADMWSLGMEKLDVVFPSPVLPLCVCKQKSDSFQFACVTSDWALNVFKLPYNALRTDANVYGNVIESHGATLRVALGEYFARLGNATSLVYTITSHVCIGTENGSIISIELRDVEEEFECGSIFELKSSTGLLGSLSSYFGFAKEASTGSCVDFLLEVVVKGSESRSVVCSLHGDASLRVWDLHSRSVVHNVGLLPPEKASMMKAQSLTSSVDLLNENGCFLIVPFTTDAGGEEETDVCLFEMTLEDRNGVYQVHLDNGPRLSGVEGKVTSASLEYMGSNYKLWHLNQTEDGPPKVKCISFKGNAMGNQHEHGDWLVETVEERLAQIVPITSIEKCLIKILCMIFQQKLEEKIKNQRGREAGRSYQDPLVTRRYVSEIFSPGNLNMYALEAALSSAGLHVDFEEDSCSLQKQISACIGAQQGAESILEIEDRGKMLFESYLSHYCKMTMPISVQVSYANSSDLGYVLMLRADGRVSYMRKATLSESVVYSIPHSGQSRDTVKAFNMLSKAFASPSVTCLLRFAFFEGLDYDTEILPEVVRVLKGITKAQIPLSYRSEHDLMLFRAFLRSLPLKAAYMNSQFNIHNMDVRLLVCSGNEDTPEEVSLTRAFTRLMSGTSLVTSAVACAVYSNSRSEIDILFRYSITMGYFASIAAMDAKSSHDSMTLTCIAGAAFSFWLVSPNAQLLVDSDRAKMEIEPLLTNDAAVPAPKRVKLGSKSKPIDPLFAFLDCFQLPGIANKSPDANDIGGIDDLIPEFVSILLTKKSLGLQKSITRVMISLFLGDKYQNRSETMKPLIHVVSGIEQLDGVEIKLCTIYAKILEDTSNDMSVYGERKKEDGIASSLFALCEECHDSSAMQQLRNCVNMLGGKSSILETELREADELKTVSLLDALASLLEKENCRWAALKFSIAAARLASMIYKSTPDGIRRSSQLWTHSYKLLENMGKTEEAYVAMLEVVDPKRQVDCIVSLVDHLCNHHQLEQLYTLPFAQPSPDLEVCILDEVSRTLEEKASTEDVDDTDTWSILYGFCISKGNYQSAAKTAFSYSRRLITESSKKSFEIAVLLHKSLNMAAAALELVDREDAWLEDASPICIQKRTRDLQSEYNMSKRKLEYALPSIIHLDDLYGDIAVAKACMLIASHIPNANFLRRDHDEIFSQLLVLGLFQEVWSFATAVFGGSTLEESKIQVIKALASHILEVERDEYSDEYSDALSANRDAWDELKRMISESEMQSYALGDRLRLAAIETIISQNLETQPPMWILEPYSFKMNEKGILESQAREANTTGLIRILLQHRRVDLAADYANAMLAPITSAVPSISLSSTACVCLPHQLLYDTLGALRKMSHQDPVLKNQEAILSSRLGQVQQALSAQTTVIEDIFSA
eukprot:jgi/Picsp_1/1295/NSC_04776-R1_nuclear pore complex protein nup160